MTFNNSLMKETIHSLYEKAIKGDLILSFEGVITSEILDAMFEKAEARLTADNENPRVIKKVYNILVEALQNLYHHLEIPPDEFFDQTEYPKGSHFAFFCMLKESSGVYRIKTGNFVRNQTCYFLRDRIEQLNYLSQDELKDLYKIVLNNDEFSEKGGGGLGFIEMARKSGNKFGFDFVRQNKDYLFFILEVLIS